MHLIRQGRPKQGAVLCGTTATSRAVKNAPIPLQPGSGPKGGIEEDDDGLGGTYGHRSCQSPTTQFLLIRWLIPLG